MDLFQELIVDLRPIVKSIESSPALCKDHYDQYMAILTEMHCPTPRHLALLAIALVCAGANQNGVTAALKLVQGNPLN